MIYVGVEKKGRDLQICVFHYLAKEKLEIYVKVLHCPFSDFPGLDRKSMIAVFRPPISQFYLKIVFNSLFRRKKSKMAKGLSPVLYQDIACTHILK